MERIIFKMMQNCFNGNAIGLWNKREWAQSLWFYAWSCIQLHFAASSRVGSGKRGEIEEIVIAHKSMRLIERESNCWNWHSFTSIIKIGIPLSSLLIVMSYFRDLFQRKKGLNSCRTHKSRSSDYLWFSAAIGKEIFNDVFH